MKEKKISKFRKVILTIISFLMMVSFVMLSDFSSKKINANAAETIIELDLNAGNISISSTTYSGYVYELNASNNYVAKSVSGTHRADNVYYIYQTKQDKITRSTDLSRKLTADIKDVEAYYQEWDEIARNDGRSPTNNRVDISASGVTTNIVLDNIWSTYQNETSGGINLPNHSTANSITTIKLKGDSRLYRINYVNKNSTNKSKMTFTSYYGNGSFEGTLTVVGNQLPLKSNGSYRTPKSPGSSTFSNGYVPYNHWNSVIGATDSTDHSCGMYFLGGTVYSGSTKWENCTAIGAGGNGTAYITVDGGKVIAVSSTTGTALGGGIAHQAQGGKGYVTINSGEVYAYNFGAPYAETLNSSERKTMINSFGGAEFIPGTAIGGGSSVKSTGNLGDVTINGGYVYAESLGGAGIGGGNTVQGNGGEATIRINGGEVHSISTHTSLEPIVDALGSTITTVVESGAGIGGGFSEKANGGKGTVVINGGRVIANGIGGGNTIAGYGGDSNVTINGGTVSADSIGGGFSSTNGFAAGKVIVTGGSVDTTMASIPVNENGEMVFITRIALYKDDVPQINLKIDSLVGENLDNYAVSSSLKNSAMKDVYTDSIGMLYFFLPDGAMITDLLDENNNTFSALEELDGHIAVKEIGKLLYHSTQEHHMINVLSSDYYELFNDIDCYDEFNGVRFIEKNSTFTFYVKLKKDENNDLYYVTPYFAVTDSSGNKTYREGSMNKISDELYSITITASSDFEISFLIEDNGKKIFTFDLTNGDITIKEDSNGSLKIIQDGHELSGYEGIIYITSGGYPTSNKIIVDAPDREVNVSVCNLIVSSADAPVNVKNGTLVIRSTESDDYIISSGGPAMKVSEDATIKFVSSGMSSLKVIGADNNSAIKGQGSVLIEDSGGFLIFNEETNVSVPQLSVGTYQYVSNISGKMPYSAELFDGRFTFSLIGYIKGNILYGLDDTLEGNRQNFSARGISESFTDVVSTDSYVNEDGDFVIKLRTTDSSSPIASPSIKVENGSIVSVENYTWNTIEDTNGVHNSGVLVVKGAAFADGNITIYSSSKGKLAYADYGYEGIYDTEEHSIYISLFDENRFKVYYSIDKEQYETWVNDEIVEKLDSSYLVNPSFTEVGEYTIYWYIYDTNQTSERFGSTKGSTKVIINKGKNAWNESLVCPDVVFGGSPNPKITAKWGNESIFYKYYTKDGSSYTEITEDIYLNNIGTYYVKAYIPGTNNYDQIETNYYIRFKVFKTSVYTSSISSLSQVNGTEMSLDITANGSFSVLYQFNSSLDMTLKLTHNSSGKTPLKGGIEVVMIDFKEFSTIYYYYVIKDSDISYNGNDYLISIPLELFKAMGSEDSYYELPVHTEETHLQFAIQFSEDNQDQGIFNVNLFDNVTYLNVFDNVIVNMTLLNVKTELELKMTSGIHANEVEVDFGITSTDASKSKIISFEIIKEGEDYPLNDVTISLNNNLKPIVIIGNRAIFNLGPGSVNNMNYVLSIENIDSGSYIIKGTLNLIDTVDDYNYFYINDIGSKSSSIEVEISEKINTQLAVYETSNIRIISTKQDLLLDFGVKSNDFINDIEISYTRKVNGVYGTYNLLNVIHPISNGNNVFETVQRVDLSVIENLLDGTYRIKFVQGTAICYYNIIIDLQ